MKLLRLCLVLVWPLVTAVSCAAGGSDARALDTVALVAADGSAHDVKVEVMRTPRELWTGLRWRTTMALDHGMLFDLGQVRVAYFTMSDTIIPLDMLFIAPNGRIAALEAMTVPGNVGPYSSKVPVRAVLELNAGTAARLGIKRGDRVSYKLFVPPRGAVPSSAAPEPASAAPAVGH